MHVLIVGAGIGGLAAGLGLARAGHRVTVFEQASSLSEVGAGIQLAPNATRILENFGILQEVLDHASLPSGTIVRRYSNDVEIGPRSHSDDLETVFGAPMLVIHRADLHRILVDAARASGVELLLGSHVQSLDPNFAAAISLKSGQTIVGDIVIAADGINSRTRAQMVDLWGIKDHVTSTGDSAYRVTIPTPRLVGCSELIDPINAGISTRWIGPRGHIMAYPIRDKSLYNVVMVHPNPSTSTDESDMWARKGSIKDLRSFYKDWSPAVQHIVRQIETDDLMEWPLNKRPTLPSWSINRVCLLGDAAHPMLPYVAQGAAQAIEDAAALAVCISSLPTPAEAFSAYEQLRKSRAEAIQASAAEMRKVLHYEDGPEQERRDATMRAPRVAGYKHPDLWADPQFQQIVWGHDVIAEAARVCRELKSETVSESTRRHML